MLMQFTAELTAVKCQFSDFFSKLRLWVEVKTAISEGSNGYPKSCLGAKKNNNNKNSVSPVNPSFNA